MRGINEWTEASEDREEKLMRAAVKAVRFMLMKGYGFEDPAFFKEVGELEKGLGVSCDESVECDSRYGSRETTPP